LKLRPLYKNVHYASDASQTAVKAVRCVTDPVAFAAAEDAEYDKLAGLSQIAGLRDAAAVASQVVSTSSTTACPCCGPKIVQKTAPAVAEPAFAVVEPVETTSLKDIPFRKLISSEVMPFFDWRMFDVVCGTAKAGDDIKEEMRSSAKSLLDTIKYDIRVAVRFFECYTEEESIKSSDGLLSLPMLRHGSGESLCDFLPDKSSGKMSGVGLFAASVFDDCETDLLHHAVRVSLAEAASGWIKNRIGEGLAEGLKIIMPGIGYNCCPDHSLKADVLALLPPELEIRLTESFAMLPESSVCGLVIAHPLEHYTDIPRLSEAELSDYARRRGISLAAARQLLGYLVTDVNK
jgi:5-methyltetrahydrofolate--homocysteine methyltransferase